MDLKISISEIKKNTVFYIAYVDNPNKTGISKEQFITSVVEWAHSYFKEVIGHQVPLSIFKDIEDDAYNLIVVPDIQDSKYIDKNQDQWIPLIKDITDNK